MLEFSSTTEFNDPTKIRGFIFTTRDPHLERVIRETLISARWTEVKRLIGAGMGYFRTMAWDDIGRETICRSEVFYLPVVHPILFTPSLSPIPVCPGYREAGGERNREGVEFLSKN
jgi:hypothetical protein